MYDTVHLLKAGVAMQAAAGAHRAGLGALQHQVAQSKGVEEVLRGRLQQHGLNHPFPLADGLLARLSAAVQQSTRPASVLDVSASVF